MALPLLLPLLGIGAAAGAGRARNQQREEAAQAAADQRGQDTASQMAAAGFQPGPLAGRTPEQMQQLGGIAQSLASPNPQVQAFGRDQLGVMQDVAGTNMTPKQQIELEQEQLKLAAMRNPQVVHTPEFVRTTATNLQNARRADLLPYGTNLQNFRELNAALSQRSGPASMAATFKFIQGLDDSVVRESEGAMLRGGSGVANSLISAYNKAIGEGELSNTVAEEIYQAALAIAEQQQMAAREVLAEHDRRLAAWAQQLAIPNLDQMVGRPTQFRNQPLPAFSRPRPETEPKPKGSGEFETANDGTEFERLE